MKKSYIKILLVIQLAFIFISNLLNFVAIGTTQWLQISYTSGGTTYNLQRYIWGSLQGDGTKGLNIHVFALIATGTVFNIICLMFAVLSVLSLVIKKIRKNFGTYFVVGCLVTSLLALLFNTTGWYFVMNDDIQQDLVSFTIIFVKFGYSFWLMTPTFACNILAAHCKKYVSRNLTF